MTLVKLLLIIAAFFVAAQAWIRLRPLRVDRLSTKPGPDAPGRNVFPAGAKAVIPLGDLPENAPERLRTIAAGWPRTERLGSGIDPAVFVTRSRIWGITGVTRIWEAEGNLHIHAQLVFGRSDFGVNAHRLMRWLAALEAED